MKVKTNFAQLTAIAVFLFVVMIGCTEKTESHEPATAEELSQMNKDFGKAINNKDAETASLLYAENASIMPPNEQIVTGRENIKKYWQAFIDAGVSDLSVATISTGSDGDLGYETGRFRLSIPGKDGKMTEEKGKYIEILKRDANGKWISLYGIWNEDPSQSE